MLALNCLTSEYLVRNDIFNNNGTYQPSDIENLSYDYNCMSYVFNAIEWLLPFDEDDDAEDILEELGVSKPYTEVCLKKLSKDIIKGKYNNPFLMKLAVKRMLKTFPDLRLIDNFNDLKEDEYGIVYACNNDDFHFGRYEDGVYSHKMGSCPIREAEDENEIFYGRYNSERIYFAMKKRVVNVTC